MASPPADWPEATSLARLLAAVRRAARGKRDQAEVARFVMDAESECLALQESLRLPPTHSRSWWPGPARSFAIRDPKPRVITELPFKDRVVHHALCALLEPALDRYAIGDSFACRAGKGQHAAVARARELVRGAQVGGWYMKGDVAAYFASIHHERLMELLARRVSDPTLLGFIEKIVRAYPVGPNRGLPIGAQTSQHLANLYLGALDHYIKDDLGVRRYLRYMDDFIAFGERTAMHALRRQVETFLGQRLDLRLNLGTSAVRPLRDGVPFLGLRVYAGLIRPSAERWRRFRRRHEELEAAVRSGQMDEEEAGERLASLFAHLAQYNTYRLRSSYLARLHEQGSNEPETAGADQTRLEPGQTGRVVEQRRPERARGEPGQRRPRQPQRQPGVSFSELSTGPELRRGAAAEARPEACDPRIPGLRPGADPIRVRSTPAPS